MKEFLEIHDTIIEYGVYTDVKTAKHGDVVPHKKRVTSAAFFNPIRINGNDVYIKVVLSARHIIEMAEKIKELESQVTELPFEELPF